MKKIFISLLFSFITFSNLNASEFYDQEIVNMMIESIDRQSYTEKKSFCRNLSTLDDYRIKESFMRTVIISMQTFGKFEAMTEYLDNEGIEYTHDELLNFIAPYISETTQQIIKKVNERCIFY